MIKINNSTNCASIENNVISNSDLAGIDLYDKRFPSIPIYISKNSIFNNKQEGIFSFSAPVTIYANEIYNNGFGSEAKNGVSLTAISHLGNSTDC